MNLPALLAVLLGLTLPLWLLAGFGDWLCHRRSRIEQTSGPRESALHLLLYLLVAVPLALGLWLEINALLLLIMAAGVLAHMAASLWDTSFAQPRRHISPLEQQVHSHLEMLPLFALALVCVLHWNAVQQPAWTWALRERPLPDVWRWGVMAALVPGMLMIIEELVRCVRAARKEVARVRTL
jgi:hypothetical protein